MEEPETVNTQEVDDTDASVGATLLHQTQQRLNASDKKKADAIWDFIELMKLKNTYDKTDFTAHLCRVKQLGLLHEKVSTLHAQYNEIEKKIEAVQDMANMLKADIDRAKKAKDSAAVQTTQEDYDDNEAILEEHNLNRNKKLQALHKLFSEYKFPTR